MACLLFQHALSLDDRSSQANTVVVHYLLGCAQFLLKHYKSSRKSFEQCLLSFRKIAPDLPDKGEVELDMAAPWVAANIRTLTKSFGGRDDRVGETEERERERQRAVEKDWRMEKGFCYRMFIPEEPKRGQAVTSRQSGRKKSKEWKEWWLERWMVEGNRSVAKIWQERKEGALEDDEELDIMGVPGGALFWPPDPPITPGIQSAFKTRAPTQPTPTSSKRQRHEVPPSAPQPPVPPIWNPETQSFNPYILPPPTTYRKIPWLDNDVCPVPPLDEEGTRQHDLGVISPSDYDHSPPDTEGTEFLNYYYKDNSPHVLQSGPTPSTSSYHVESNTSPQYINAEHTPSILNYYTDPTTPPFHIPTSGQIPITPNTRASILPWASPPISPSGTLVSSPTRSAPTDPSRETARQRLERGTEESRLSAKLGFKGEARPTSRLQFERGAEARSEKKKRVDRDEALAALEGRRPATAGSMESYAIRGSIDSGSRSEGQRPRERTGGVMGIMRRSMAGLKRGSRGTGQDAEESMEAENVGTSSVGNGRQRDWRRGSVSLPDENAKTEENRMEVGDGKYLGGVKERKGKEHIPIPKQPTAQGHEEELDDSIMEGLGAGGLLLPKTFEGLGPGGLLLPKAYVPQ